jgi:hypothetical protein
MLTREGYMVDPKSLFVVSVISQVGSDAIRAWDLLSGKERFNLITDAVTAYGQSNQQEAYTIAGMGLKWAQLAKRIPSERLAQLYAMKSRDLLRMIYDVAQHCPMMTQIPEFFSQPAL